MCPVLECLVQETWSDHQRMDGVDREQSSLRGDGTEMKRYPSFLGPFRAMSDHRWSDTWRSSEVTA